MPITFTGEIVGCQEYIHLKEESEPFLMRVLSAFDVLSIKSYNQFGFEEIFSSWEHLFFGKVRRQLEFARAGSTQLELARAGSGPTLAILIEDSNCQNSHNF